MWEGGGEQVCFCLVMDILSPYILSAINGSCLKRKCGFILDDFSLFLFEVAEVLRKSYLFSFFPMILF